MNGHPLDAAARRLFDAAIREDRCGELLGCLFDGGSATVSANGEMVLASASMMEQLRRGHTP